MSGQVPDKSMNAASSSTEVTHLLIRITRAVGHLRKVRKMVEDGEDCSKVLIQLSAVSGALSSIGKVIMSDYLDECMIRALETGNMDQVERFKEIMNRFAK